MGKYPEYISDLFQEASRAAYSGDKVDFENKLVSVLSDSKKKNEILDTLYESFGIPDLIKKGESLIDKEKHNYFYSYIDKTIKSNIEKILKKYLGENMWQKLIILSQLWMNR